MLLWTTNLVEDQFDLLKKIKFLLKERGLTINGVKKMLDKKKIDGIDVQQNFGVYKPNDKSARLVKDKVKNITKIIKEIKKLKNG